MNLLEYERIKDFTYGEYCDYLQDKYGIGKYDYMTKNYNKNNKSSRTSEGLIGHHKYESHAIMLSTKQFAMLCPFEWQLAENIVYCDYLEHLLLHVLITEQSLDDKDEPRLGAVGIGGVINFIAPELNDMYSGFVTKQKWRQTCYDSVIDDKDTYLAIIKRFKHSCKDHSHYVKNCLYVSYNESHGLWLAKQNQGIYHEIYCL